jgi:Beta-lactamase enzyme family
MQTVVSAAPRPRAWRPGTASARSYARRREGIVSFAVLRGRRSWSFRGRTPSRSASVVKAMLLAAYLRAPGVRTRALAAGELATLGAMITRSDNDAATSIHALVGSVGLTEVARRARMRDFAAAPAWGVSRLTAADGARLMLRFERLVPRRHRALALSLLARIVPEQRWGVADAAPRGWRVHFKGGWDVPQATVPAVNHQIALLRRGRQRVAIAILTSGGPSQGHTSETQRGVAARLLRGLADTRATPRRGR